MTLPSPLPSSPSAPPAPAPGLGADSVFDVVVIGLGAVGSALAMQLAQRGVRVLGLDRFSPPHDRGSSHGATRITRLSVGEGAAYVPLVRRSHALWPQIEAAAGARLFERTGLMVVGTPASAAAAYHGQPDFLGQTFALAQRFGIAHERLSPAQVRDRFPAFRLAEGDAAYFEPEGGVLFPEACVAAQCTLAERHGATLRRGTPVTAIEPQGPGGRAGVVVHTPSGAFSAAQAVLCAGAWTPQIALQVAGATGSPVSVPAVARLRVLRQVLHWFEPEQPAWFDAAQCPAFMWLHGPTPADAFYGFPRVDGRTAVKVATEQFEVDCTPDAVQREVAPQEAADLHRVHLAGRLAGLSERVADAAVCLYTQAPDGRFLVDAHPAAPALTVVSACSGHGFKHSAGLGEALAQRLCGEMPAVDLSPFAFEPTR